MAEAKIVLTAEDKASRSVAGLGDALGALRGVAVGVAKSLGLLLLPAALVRSISAGIEALKDLSEASGASVENVSALEDIAARTGTSLDAVGGALIKFNKALNEAQNPESDAAILLQELGLNAKELARLDPAVGLLKTAQALEQFADGGGKARAELLLLGKSTRELAPFLKDLAEAGSLNATVTSQQAAEAEKFNNNLHALTKSSLDFGRSIVSEVLPALNIMFEQINSAGGVWAAYKASLDLGLNQVAIQTTQDKIAELRKEIETLERRMTQGQSPMANAFERLFGKQASEQIHLTTQSLRELQEQERKLQAQRYEALGAGKSTAGAGRGNVIPEIRTKPQFNADAIEAAKRAAAEAKKLEEERIAAEKRRVESYNNLVKSIAERNAIELEEGRSIGKSTDAEKFKAKVLSEIEGGSLKLTAAERQNVDIGLNNIIVREKIRLADEASSIQMRESREETARTIEGEQRRLEQYELNAAAAGDQLDEFGLTNDALQRLIQIREADTISALRSKAATMENIGALGDLRQLYLDQANALETRGARLTALAAKEKFARTDAASGAKRAVAAYIEEVNNAGDAMGRVVAGGLGKLEDALTDLFTKGKFDARSFIDAMIAEFVRLQVVKPMIARIFGSGEGSGGGGFLGLLGLLGGGGGNTSDFGPIIPKAAGGPVMAGQTYIVGEKGPEFLHMGSGSGSITPNGWAGGTNVTVRQTINVGSGVNASQLANAMQQAKEQAKSEIANQMSRGSKVYA